MPTVGLESALMQATVAIQQSAALGSVLQDSAPQVLSTPSLHGLVQGLLQQDNFSLQQANQGVQENESAGGQGPLATMLLSVLGSQLDMAESRDGSLAQVFGVDLTPAQGLGLTSGPGQTTSQPTNPPSQLTNPPPQIPALNQAILDFAKAHLGYEVGGGQCAPFVEEALRAEGGNFFFAQNLNTTDYVWGNLVTQVTAVNGHPVYSNPSAFILPGDIMQFQDVTLSFGNGSSNEAGQHTAIVASVDASGRPTAVYEQNVNGNLYVRLDPINLNTLTAGTIHVYQPIPRQDTAGQTQYSVFNDTQQSQTVKLFSNGQLSSTFSLASNSPLGGNYLNGYGYGNLTISVGNSPQIPIHNAGGYEVYTTNGQTAIRQV